MSDTETSDTNPEYILSDSSVDEVEEPDHGAGTVYELEKNSLLNLTGKALYFTPTFFFLMYQN
jgi:hypothetical protein